jgi:hypothetical protein
MLFFKKFFLGLFISNLVAPSFYAYIPEEDPSMPPIGSDISGESSSSVSESSVKDSAPAN